MEERLVTAQVRIRQHLRKITYRLVSMNTEKQRDGTGHRLILKKKTSAMNAPNAHFQSDAHDKAKRFLAICLSSGTAVSARFAEILRLAEQ
jgi:hypothetical protein